MTPAQIIQYARDLSGCRTDELSDPILYSYLNAEYRKLRQVVAGIDKNYKLRTWNTNLVAGVSSYALSVPTQAPGATTGQIKIENLLIKYDNSTNYAYPARLMDWDNLKADPAFYADSQPITAPIYIITDNSIQIFPTPTVSVPNGITLYANQRPYDLTSTLTESDILLEREYHDVIAWSIIPYIYQHRQQDERVGYYQQQYAMKKQEMETIIKKRAIRPMVGFNATFNEYVGSSRYRYK